MPVTLGENKTIVRRFLEEVFNERNFSVVDELVSDSSTDEAEQSLVMYLVLQGFPDFRVNIERMVAEDDKVAVLSTFGGTHTRTFMGIKPTGKGVLGRKIDIFTIRGGKIVNILYNIDVFQSLMIPLGAFPKEAMFTGPGSTLSTSLRRD
jgi:predicted ester cyclase